MRSVHVIGCCLAIAFPALGPASAQTAPPKQTNGVTVQKQLYRYIDNEGTKILGYTEDLSYNGTTFTNLATASGVVKFRTCIKTEIDVPRKELKPIQGNCEGDSPKWGVTASQALEGWVVSTEGATTKFSLKDKDGKETIFSLPSELLVGFKPKTDTKVLFTKPPTSWTVEFANATKSLESVDSQKIAKIIKEDKFSVYSASR
jgi:hypothetical protein